MSQQSFSVYKCDRCKVNDAVRLHVSIRGEEMKMSKEVIDICTDCAIMGFGLLLRQVDEKERAAWIRQFKNGLM